MLVENEESKLISVVVKELAIKKEILWGGGGDQNL
jgi:hypothetical protein